MTREEIGENVNGVSGVTTPAIVYDEALPHFLSTAEETSPSGFAKRFRGLSELFLASSMVLTTPALSLFDLRQWEMISHSTTWKRTESGIQTRRRITIGEARQIALRAHYQFEEGLRNDRIQEARLMEIVAHENEA